MSVATHYDTLKVTRDAPAEVIQAAYKSLAQKYHPDRNVGNPEAVQMMQLINEAYRALADGRKKAEHDAWIRQQDPPKPPPALSPKEKELKAKSDETAAEAKKWSDWAGKTVAEARDARSKANKARAQLATAPADKKAAFEAMVAREEAAATSEETKAATATQKAVEAAELAMKHYFSKDGKAAATHYDTLHVTHDAPPEVIQAAARTLVQKYNDDPAQVSRLLAVNTAYGCLSDPAKKAEHDSWVHKQHSASGHPVASAQTPRKATAREIEAKARADKAEAEATALEAWADQAKEGERAALAKAAEAQKTAQQRAKEKDAAAWATWAQKTAVEAQQETSRAAKAAAKASEARLRAQATRNELEDAKAEADREAAMWAADKNK